MSKTGPLCPGLCCKTRFSLMTKFCGPWARLSCTRCEGPHGLTQNSQATSVTRLRSYVSAIARCLVFSRRILSPATFDFCNTIGQELTCRWSLFHQRGARWTKVCKPATQRRAEKGLRVSDGKILVCGYSSCLFGVPSLRNVYRSRSRRKW